MPRPAASSCCPGSASAEVTDYRLDMALRWAAIHRVAAVAAFSAEEWRPAVTAMDIAGQADIALVSVPADAELAGLVRAVMREIGGGAERALGRAEQGLEAVRRAERAGAGPEELGQAAGRALGTEVEYVVTPGSAGSRGDDRPVPARDQRDRRERAGAGRRDADRAFRRAGGGRRDRRRRRAGAARRGGRRRHGSSTWPGGPIETPVRSRSELLAELLMSDSAISEDLLDRARQLGIPVSGWHVAVRVEADDLDEAEHDEVRRFELLESAGQAALQAVAAAGETWYLSRIARAIVLIRMTTLQPGPAGRGQGGPVGRTRAAGHRGPAARAAVPGRRGGGARGPDGAARLGRRGPGRAGRRAGRAPVRPGSPPTTRSASGGC